MNLRPELLAAVRTILEATMEDELNALILAGELRDSGPADDGRASRPLANLRPS